MKVSLVINYLSILVWLMPPVKQYKTQYFTFFVILALFDPILYSIYFVFGIQPARFYPILTSLLIISLSNIKERFLWIAIFILILILTYVYYHNQTKLYSLCIILFSIVLYQVVSKLLQIVIQQRLLNLFLSLLLFYSLINEFKFIAIALSLYQGSVSFYLASFTQIFLGISFSFISINTKNFLIPSKLL